MSLAIKAHPAQVRAPENRRAEDLGSRGRILAAAEEMFAQYGYDGASLRQVALRAGVPAGLIGYHFSGKFGLYRAIFDIRAPAVVEQRQAGLAAAALEPDPVRRLELILGAILGPMFRLTSQEGSGHFGMLLAREIGDPRAAERGIVARMFDPVAMAVIGQLREVFPGRPEAELHWAYHTVVGAMVYMMLDCGRIARLSRGAADPRDVEAMTRHLTALLLGCLQGSPAAASQETSP